ncbi:MAG: hypothetical protein HN428_06670 [Proteobacteria bacterium]|jgi:hypothetical protein|nr:hypothetical protein [Pseudomonadota bacterium]MBT5327089.1 hypothetical protein [Gemmatimonadota bacterium]
MVKNKAAAVVRRLSWLLGLIIVTGPLSAVAQQGHTVSGSQVLVEGRRHWENWKMPANLAFIDSSGSVAPRAFRTVYDLLADTTFKRPLEIFSKDTRIATIDSTVRRNAEGELLLDTQDNPIFDYVVRPGVSRVGSNPQLAANIYDGDPTTYWEPDPNDPVSEWWIEVDLARVVPLERLRLQFVGEEMGDPFYKFVLLLSELQTPSRFEEGNLRFSRLVPFESANTDQRVFVFESGSVSEDLPPSDHPVEEKLLAQAGVATGRHQTNFVASGSNLEWTGRKTETIRIVITDSRQGRAEKISEEDWENLPISERGDIAHFVKDVSGRQEPVDAATYQALEPSRQGRRDFYRRELPRLAEVGAWGWGDNLSLGLAQDGGSISHTFLNAAPIAAFDGDGATRYRHAARDPEKPEDNIMVVDIGGSIWLDQIRYFAAGMRGYVMRGSSGVRDAQGQLVWQTISPAAREKNVDNGFFTTINDVLDRAIKLRFLELTTFVNANVDNVGATIDNFWPWITEVQIYSRGPAAEVVIESDLIALSGNYTLGAIEWDAKTPPGTEVQIRTRTGNQLYQIVRYFKNSGESQTEAEYSKLPGFLKGETDTTMALGPDWSSWSQGYTESGDRVTSPSLRSFVQIQARLISNVRSSAASLSRITVQLHDPIAQELAAELWPIETSAGMLDTFAVFILPGFIENPPSQLQLGFDEVMLRSEPSWDMNLIDVAVGSDESFAAENPTLLFDQVVDNDLVNDAGDKVEVVSDRSDSLWVRFPESLKSDAGRVEGKSYFRKLLPGDEVPVAVTGEQLTLASHSLLPLEERGATRYFRYAEGQRVAAEISQEDYESLSDAERGTVRYFRIISALGDISSFDRSGEKMTLEQYNQLSEDQRGPVVGNGDLIRLRFTSRIFVQGSNVKVAVRSSSRANLWQEAQAGDVTSLRPGRTLEILPIGARNVVSQAVVTPKIFTPNGDRINDETSIEFTLFRVHAARPVTVSLHSLDGRQVRSITSSVAGGQQRFVWDGRDQVGAVVPPGMYIASIEVSTDASDAVGRQVTLLVGVAY